MLIDTILVGIASPFRAGHRVRWAGDAKCPDPDQLERCQFHIKLSLAMGAQRKAHSYTTQVRRRSLGRPSEVDIRSIICVIVFYRPIQHMSLGISSSEGEFRVSRRKQR